MKKCRPLGKIILKFTGENNLEFLVPTPLRIENELWDADKERPKNIYLKSCKKLNAKLDRLRIALTTYLKQLESKNTVCTPEILGRCVKKYCSEPNGYSEGSLLYYMQLYIESRLHLITKATYKRYMVFFRLMQRFEGHRMKQLMLDSVNAGFVRDFILFGEKEQYSKSTIYRTVNFVRTILNYLEKRGIRTFAYELELPKQRTIKKSFVTLNEAELAAIRNTEISEELKPARDWLVISCYTGQRVSDFLRFTDQMMETIEAKMYLSFVQQKTGKQILLPLHPVVSDVLKNNSGCFPEKIPVQKFNEQIKQVARLAGINKPVTVRKRLGFRTMLLTIPKWKAVSSHIGRRSFATNFYGRIPTTLLMEATGHGTEEMFLRYIGTADTGRATELGNCFEAVYGNGYI
ncbi:phage integrase SAM-like domain-containing protein [Flavobacterium dauae]|uniref:phage integrase SAM-like domain-containing protein n=1 Tax=Flavobacterium dauae TaxID=1563479 RepID=UPI00272DD538|nr:phage integrase SAM-like domain-containing protein [Flavobacterium dauae]WLD24304.1 phage integrase SAM-like domain-containing protein [Flavobacterium dauae]